MSLLTTPYLGGTFNTPILFGIQLYLWLAVGIIIMAIISELVWRVSFWNPMTPFHGLWYSFKSKSNAAFVFDLRQYWDLISEGGAKLIFDKTRYDFGDGFVGSIIKFVNFRSSEHISFAELFRSFRIWLFRTDYSVHTAKLLQGDWDEYPLVTIGQTPSELIFDAYHWTDARSVDREQIAKCVDIYNETNPNDEIHSLSKFYRYATMKQPKIVCPGVKLTVTVPWVRVDAAFPLKRYKASWAGFLRQMAEDLAGKMQGDINRFAILIACLGVVICILMFIGKWLHLV